MIDFNLRCFWQSSSYKNEFSVLYDKNGNKTDLTYFKGDSIPIGYYPMVVMIAIENSDGKFLMQILQLFLNFLSLFVIYRYTRSRI